MLVYGFGTHRHNEQLVPVKFTREEPRADEVVIKVTHCGVCHSDLHQARNDWENTIYPCVPGHEVVGEVIQTGDKVSKYQTGDRVGVGCMIDSCLACDNCNNNEENYCQSELGCTLTYNGPKKSDQFNTYGGYSTTLVVKEDFVLRIPEQLDSSVCGPLMCAGITVYSPMKHWNLQKDQVLGVAGIGGLGHMAIKFGKALGAKVIAFTRSESKKESILQMGADEVVISTDDMQMENKKESLDMLINTIPVEHDINPYVLLMKTDAHLITVGNMINFPDLDPGPLVFNRVTLAGSLIGGIKQTQEVLDLAAAHGIRPEIKMISIDQINDVFDELASGNDEKFRHVIDMQTLRHHEAFENDLAKDIKAPSNRSM